METRNFMEFGRQRQDCYVMNEGFVLWRLDIHDDMTPVILNNEGDSIFVHIIVLDGELEIKRGCVKYSLTRNCFADFIDNTSLTIRHLSEKSRAFIMVFSGPFIASLMKNAPPFPPSYVLHVKACPVMMMPSDTTVHLVKRVESILEVFGNPNHCFYTKMMNCMLRIYMMDVANEYINQVNNGEDHTDVSRKQDLFKQLARLLIDHVQEERSVSWYASELCVTPQYLNRAIKSISQKTVYEHICIALTGRLIERLEDSGDSISQIADDFNFPDLTTMTKFFKRQTGKTPTEYRKDVSK